MLTLVVNNNKAYIWNAKDWLILREKHRIVGELIGCLSFLPRQHAFPGLPLALLPEEVRLLVEEKIVKLVHYPALYEAPSKELKQEFQQHRVKMCEEQTEHYMDQRKRQLSGIIDQIVEGKRRKLIGHENLPTKINEDGTQKETLVIIDKSSVLQEEFAKIIPINESSSVIQIFTAHPWHSLEDQVQLPLEESNEKQNLRYQTFKSLWKKGYYITAGTKFGVDFLIYPGDPIKFHAHFLVICTHRSLQIPILDLVALGRLGTSVRKTVVIASMADTEDNEIVFQSITWNGTSRSL